MNSALRVLLFTGVMTVVSLAGWAAVTLYNQDFESMALPSPGALLGDNWLVFGNVYDSGGTYLYGYGPYPAPNDGAAFCAIATGQGGPTQGDQQLSVYSDYNNPDHGVGHLIESNVFQEQTIEVADVGTTVVFTFDAKFGNLEGASEAEAYIKTVDPAAGYATTNHVTIDMTTLPLTWSTYSIRLAIDPGLVGQLLQFGFTTRASYYEGSGVYYDNVRFEAALFVDGFESGDLSAWSVSRIDGGWVVDGSTTPVCATIEDWRAPCRLVEAVAHTTVRAGSSIDPVSDSAPSFRSARPPTTVSR
jgi:hypothetical protein